MLNKIIESGKLEYWVNRLGAGEQQFNRDDLIQDLYLDLTTKDPEVLKRMVENDELDYYLYRMVANNIFSKTSRYYKNYKDRRKIELLDDKEDTEYQY